MCVCWISRWVVHWYGGYGCKPGRGITIDGVVVGWEVVIGGVSSSGVGCPSM